jgi:hypothetical protein
MKRQMFIHGVLLAAVLAFAVSAIIATVTPFTGFFGVARLVIPAAAIAYILFLFRQSDERIGRMTTLSLWSLFAIVTWWFSPSLAFYLLLHVSAVWLVRSLYFYSGVFPSILDLGLSLFSITAFGWAIERTGSIFVGVWCFFLVQALFVVIPSSVATRKDKPDSSQCNDSFDRARRQANQALQQLFTQ